ncbi:methyltransferase domain-containing protein [Pseudomonas sp. R2.Fl]|nr:methyltransferase domain-containing protein [Pseudomonas sp. R2.Fl]
MSEVDRSGRATAKVRAEFARRMASQVGASGDGRLAAAFAAVPRETFLGPPPWLLADHFYGESQTSDPEEVYRDVLIPLDRDKGINNGSPSLHALGLHALEPQPGETVLHAGAGTGYYSAILAELVGPGGRVTAVEYDRRLAAVARERLAGRANVEVVHGNSAEWPKAPVEIVYVNFACDRPAERWIDGLKEGGRLLFPLGVPGREGRMPGTNFSDMAGYLLVRRRKTAFEAGFITGVSFIWGEGLATADAEEHARLAEAFHFGGWRGIRSLRWKKPARSGAREWFGAEDWGLSYDPAIG